MRDFTDQSFPFKTSNIYSPSSEGKYPAGTDVSFEKFNVVPDWNKQINISTVGDHFYLKVRLFHILYYGKIHFTSVFQS